MPDFTSGFGDPKITPDAGAGAYDSESMSLDTLAFKQAFYQLSLGAIALIGADAVKHMAHYLNNTGKDLTIDLDGMVTDVPSAKVLFERELALAKEYVQGLSVGPSSFTSSRAENGYNQKGESTNWYFAIGGYSYWSKGKANVRRNDQGGIGYEMEWQFKFYDRYNWDGGKQVDLFGFTVTDAFMGRMHREGIAKEFDCFGTIKRNEKWGAPVTVPSAPGGGGR